MKFIIRPAQANDVRQLVDYNARLALETEHLTLDRAKLAVGVRAVLADAAKGRYFVAEYDGQVIGQVSITYEWSDWRNGWWWWVQSVYVQAEFRGQGVLRALYGHLRQLAAAQPEVVGLRLYVERENRAAYSCYLKLGMQEIPFNLMQHVV